MQNRTQLYMLEESQACRDYRSKELELFYLECSKSNVYAGLIHSLGLEPFLIDTCNHCLACTFCWGLHECNMVFTCAQVCTTMTRFPMKKYLFQRKIRLAKSQKSCYIFQKFYYYILLGRVSLLKETSAPPH